MNRPDSNRTRRASRASRRHEPAGAAEAAARAKRARDHLARKRRQQRQRLERERWRAESSGTRARVRGILTPVLFVLAFLIGVATAPTLTEIFLFNQTRLERVAVQGAVVLTPTAIAQQTRIEAGRALDMIDPAQVLMDISREPWIESARALRLPTGTLVISVVERNAVARWLAPHSNYPELIDQSGKRFPGLSELGGPLPLVKGEIGYNDSLPASAIEILDEIGRYLNLSSDPSQLTLHLPDLETVRVGSQTQLEPDSGYVLQVGKDGPHALLGTRFFTQRIARLAALLESEESKLQDVRWIDLRYADRAVLRIEPASG
jgi:cell division septal protein FtsQ